MKLKTRIILGFTMIILMPLLLFAATLYGFSQSQAQKAQAVTEGDGTVYDISITDSADSQGRVHVMAKDLFISAFVILISVALVVGLWVYRSIAVPLVKLKKATQNIKEGNLDFVLDVEGKDEFSELCQDFEEMRRRLKESTEEKSLIEKENRELISNISHDLKTPITAVKGYVEGIMDGVADTPEKMDRYVRTIYNKTNEMDHLINELTFYSKIDTNRIPYTFNKLNVEDYFEDCSEEVGLELETRGIELVYANYVEKDVMVIADGEQIRRVIHNIISNAIKYMDKPKGIIQIRIKDVGDFIQIDPGTVHAIKGGLLILETQQNSDITYRVYDYDRLQNGKPRQLHVEQSIDVIEAPFKTADIDTFTEEIPGAVHTHFVTCKFYSVDKYDIDGVFTLDAKKYYTNVSVIAGEGTVNGIPVKKGTHFIIPANFNGCRFEGKLSVICSNPEA